MNPPTKISIDPKKITHTLAMDVASQLMDKQALLAKHELTAQQLSAIVRTDEFKKLYSEAKIAWDSDPVQRIRAKAQFAVEDGLLPVHTILHDHQANPTARLEAFKQMTTLADLMPKKDTGAGGGAVSITINVPNRDESVIIEAVPSLEQVEED